jgi:UDP-glucose 4-epimerase
MKVGITGAGGFIGRQLAVRATERGHTVILVDRVAHPTLSTSPGDYASAENLFALSRCDVVLHLAAVPGVVACEQDPAGARRTNIDGLCHLADVLQARDVPLVFASTFSVVGEPTVQPIQEGTPYAPMNEYGRQKVAGEMVTRSLGKRGLIVRMSNVYGTYTLGPTTYRKGNILTLFAEQARAGTLRIHAPGTQARDFIHVEDVIAIWLAVAEHAPNASVDQTIFHAASGEMLSVRDLADLVQSLLPQRVGEEVVPNPRIEALLPEFAVSVERTRRTLGTAPRHTVRETLAEELKRTSTK